MIHANKCQYQLQAKFASKYAVFLSYVTITSLTSINAAIAETVKPSASSRIFNAKGELVGTATFSQSDSGVKVTLQVQKLSQGEHMVHLHENGKCEAPDFKSAGAHFTTPKEMGEFYEDAILILRFLKKNRNKLFTIRKVKLLGIEIPLLLNVANNVFLKGYIDFVLYDLELDKIYIYDIKTSTRGWNDTEKKDDSKIAQILLYKEYFSKQFGFDVEKIEVEYFIVKRKLYEQSEYSIPRTQHFKPASGKNKRKQAVENLNNFIKDCFDESGKPQVKSYIKNVGESSCKWCPYKDKPELCDKIAVSA